MKIKEKTGPSALFPNACDDGTSYSMNFHGYTAFGSEMEYSAQLMVMFYA